MQTNSKRYRVTFNQADRPTVKVYNGPSESKIRFQVKRLKDVDPTSIRIVQIENDSPMRLTHGLIDSYGYWEVLGNIKTSPYLTVKCRCICGTIKYVNVSNLKRGQSVSCGCRKANSDKPKARTVRTLTYEGKTQSMGAWARELELPLALIVNRKNMEWSDEKILTTPHTPKPRRTKEAI